MTDSPKAKLAAIVRRLLEQTTADALIWRETDLADRFVAKFGSGVGVEVESMTVTVRDDAGNVLDRGHAQPTGLVIGDGPQASLNRDIPKLVEAVRRMVLDVDTKLDGLLDELG